MGSTNFWQDYSYSENGLSCVRIYEGATLEEVADELATDARAARDHGFIPQTQSSLRDGETYKIVATFEHRSRGGSVAYGH